MNIWSWWPDQVLKIHTWAFPSIKAASFNPNLIFYTRVAHRRALQLQPRSLSSQPSLVDSWASAPLNVHLKKSRPGDGLVSSLHTSPLFEKASVLLLGWLAGSVQGPDRIFLFAQRRGCLSISATSGGGLSGLLITMFSPALFPSLMVCYTSKWESRLGLSYSSSLQSYATPCKQDWLSLLLPLSHVCVCVCV